MSELCGRAWGMQSFCIHARAEVMGRAQIWHQFLKAKLCICARHQTQIIICDYIVALRRIDEDVGACERAVTGILIFLPCIIFAERLPYLLLCIVSCIPRNIPGKHHTEQVLARLFVSCTRSNILTMLNIQKDLPSCLFAQCYACQAKHSWQHKQYTSALAHNCSQQ